jgi:hypothetical protein
MAPWSRKRKARTEPPAGPEPAESVRLDGDDHAWWAQEEVTRAWRPREPRAAPEPERDILAEHFGPDWRTSFGFTPHEDLEEEPGEPDPYAILEIDESATWDEIVAAHRHQVRVNHPDRLFGQSDEEKAEGDERIRVINAAYAELRVRRGR